MTGPTNTAIQSLFAPGEGLQMGMISLALITESLTNPRKTFDPARLAELADSIRATGVHQPVLLRPLPGSRLADTYDIHRTDGGLKPRPVYELVCGARRLRACRIAGVDEIPAMVREMTDQQAMEAAVIENLQREDVSELEEAEGYEYLMQQTGLTAEAVGAKIGKSRSYVYGRLKLLDLCQEGRQKIREGVLDFSRGLLIARIPDVKQQIRAIDEITKPDWRGETMGYRDAQAYVQREFMLRLDRARWDLSAESLLPKTPSCTTCPKRTGYAPDLFADVGSVDLCIDPVCYRAKDEAHSTAIKSAALARGQQIIEGREAKQLMPSAFTSHVGGYLRLDNVADSPTKKTLRQMIGQAMEQAGIQPILIANPHADGELIAVLRPDTVSALLRLTEHAANAEHVETQSQHDAEIKAKTEAETLKNEFESRWRWGILKAGWDGMRGYSIPEEAFRILALQKARQLDKEKAKSLANLLELGKVAPCESMVTWVTDHHDPEKCLALLMMAEDVTYRSWLPEDLRTNPTLLLLATDIGVNIQAVQDIVKAEIREKIEIKSRKKPAKPTHIEAENDDVPLAPAAPAGGVREKSQRDGGSGKKPRPAAQTGAAAPLRKPKTSAAQAQAQIADALQELTQGQESDPGADAQDIEAGSGYALPAPPQASAQSPAPTDPDIAGLSTDATEATGQDAPADADTTGMHGAAMELAVGVRVLVRPTVQTPTKTRWISKAGIITSYNDDGTWCVTFKGRTGGVCDFAPEHLERQHERHQAPARGPAEETAE